MKVKSFLKIFASYLILVLLTIAVMDFFLTPKIEDVMTKKIEDDMFGNAKIITLMPKDTLIHNVPVIAKQQARTDGHGKASRFSVTLQESMLYIALPIKENSEIMGYIRLARPLVEVRKSLDQLYQALYLTLYIIAIPSLLLAFIFSRKIASRRTS
jgi:two-component system phosphate regulon sensor histidine kinase PhoR